MAVIGAPPQISPPPGRILCHHNFISIPRSNLKLHLATRTVDIFGSLYLNNFVFDEYLHRCIVFFSIYRTKPTSVMSRLLAPRFLLPSRRFFSSTYARSAFATGPAPPRLPPKEQEEFERLQKSSTGAFSTPRPQINQSPDSSSKTTTTSADDASANAEAENSSARINATGKGDELHPDMRRGAKPEFEGDVNPKTGEVGGPKNEPLRWGEKGDWSYNGRVTDF